MSNDIRLDDCSSSDDNDYYNGSNIDWLSSTSCDDRGSCITSNYCGSEQHDDNNNINGSNNATASPRIPLFCCGADIGGIDRCNNNNTAIASPPPPPSNYLRLRGGKSTNACLNSNCYNTYSSYNITALEAYNRGMLFTYLISNISNHFGGIGSSYCDEYHDASYSSCCSIFSGQQNNDDDSTTTDLEIKVNNERLEREWSGH